MSYQSRILTQQISKLRRELDGLVKPEIGATLVGGVAVYDTDVQVIGTGAYAALTFDNERWDDAAFHDAVNPTRLTVPAGWDGWYTISGCCAFVANAAGNYRSIQIALNVAVTPLVVGTFPFSAAAAPYMAVSTCYYLVAGDYVQLRVFQDSGGNLNTLILANASPEFRMVRIS